MTPARGTHTSLGYSAGGEEDKNLMEAVGRINRKHGKRTVELAAAGLPGGKGISVGSGS